MGRQANWVEEQAETIRADWRVRPQAVGASVFINDAEEGLAGETRAARADDAMPPQSPGEDSVGADLKRISESGKGPIHLFSSSFEFPRLILRNQ